MGLVVEAVAAGDVPPQDVAGVLGARLRSSFGRLYAGSRRERITDREAFDVADRLGLIWVWQNRVRVSQPVEYSFYPATQRIH